MRSPRLVVVTVALALNGVLRGAGAPVTQDRPERTYRSAGCQVAFRYPADWVVAVDSTLPFTECRFRLRPAAWDSLLIVADSVEDAYTVDLIVEGRGFEDVLPSTAFRRRGDRWVVGGRHGNESAARTIGRNGWRGVWGEPLLGCFRIDGPYVAACELPVALIGTDSRSARVAGGVRSFEVFERLLHTIELAR